MTSHAVEKRKIAAFILAVIFIIAILLVADTVDDYRRTVDTAKQRLDSTRRAVAEHANVTFNATEWALHETHAHLGSRALSTRTEAEMYRYMKAIAQRYPQIGWINVKDDASITVANTAEYPAEKTPHPKLDYVEYHQQNTSTTQLFFSKPALGIITKKWRFFITRRLSAHDGSYAGNVGAALIPSYFEGIYKDIVPGSSARISLVRDDGQVLIQTPLEEDAMRANYSHRLLFTTYLKQAPAGFFRNPTSGYDASDRFISYQRIGKYPVIATVSITVEEVLAPWRQRVWVRVLTMVLVIAGALLLGWLLWKRIAESEQASAELRDSETRFIKIFDESPVITVINDIASGRYVAVNRAFVEAVWKPLELIVGKTPQELGFIVEWKDEHSTLNKVASGTDVDGAELLVRHNGKVRDYLLTSRMINLHGADHVLSLLLDITERKQAEQTLIESERKARAILDLSFGFMGLLTPEGGVVEINRSALEFAGIQLSDVVGKYFWETPWWNHSAEMQERLRGALREAAGGELARFEATHPDAGGRIHAIDFTVKPVKDDAGKVILLIPEGHDVTDRKGAEMKLRHAYEQLRAADEQMRAQYDSLVESERSLRESEGKYRRLTETAHDVIVSVDLNYKITYVNQAALNLAGGMNPVGMSLLDFTPPHAHELQEAMMQKRREGLSDVLTFEMEINLPNGNNTIFESRSTLITENDRPTGVLFVARDITERKRAEEALHESEGKFRDLTEKSMVGIYLYQDGLFKYVNAEFADTFGYVPEEIINRLSLQDVIYPEDLPLVLENIRRRSSGEEKSKRYDFRAWTKNRELRHVEVHGSQTLYQGKPALIGTVLDITDRLKSEEELRRLSIAIEQAAEDIIITDPEGVIQYVNPAFERVTGYSPAEAIGKTPSILKSGMHDGAFYGHLWKTIRRGEIWTGRITNRRKDGQLIHEDASICPLLASSGKLTGYVALKRDVTQSVALEGQLRQAQKMEAIGTLSGGIAHDFNNILGAMIGYTELAKFKTTDKKVFDYLEQVLQACDRARDLVRQILTFSRQTEQEKKPISLIPLIKEVTKFIRAALPTTIEIRQTLTAASDVVNADATQMHQLLMNLCMNAGHAMKAYGGVLEIAAEEVSIDENKTENVIVRPGRYLQLTVRDTGHGIEERLLERIFDPYFTTKGKGEGTGLGLAVVDGIVKSHGGAIKVYSEVGKGSAFHVYLPLIEQGLPDRNKKLEPPPGGNETILFVDDEPLLCEVGKMSIEELGYKVISQTDPARAIELFKEDRDAFDLVISDKTMPHMTGFDLAREIRGIRPDIPIIICSGFQEKEDSEKLSALGISHFLNKPISMRAVANAIRSALDKGKLEAQGS